MKSKNNKSSKKEHNNKADKIKEIYIQIALVGATVALFLVGWYQACQVKESMEVSNRAYLSLVEKPPPIYDISTNIASKAFIEIKNTGQSPAYNVMGIGKLVLQDSKDNAWRISDSMLIKQSSVLGANEEISFRAAETFDKKQIALIKSGELAIFFVGRVTYEDIFGECRVLNFCFSYNRETWETDYCENHNDAN